MSGIIAALFASTSLSTVSVSGRYFENDVLLLHGDGTNGGQNNTFIDSSLNNFTITRNGNTTQGSFNPYGALWSNYFDGSGDSLTAPSNAAFQFGTGDFTVEFWAYLLTVGTTELFICTRGNNLGFQCTRRGANWTFELNSSTIIATASNVLTNGAWTHIAMTRQSGTVRLFTNGVLNTTVTGNTTNFAGDVLSIGQFNTDEYFFNGYISNLRIVKGTAVYTAAFTPPTSPLTAIPNTSILTCQSNRFIDKSTNNFTITRNGDTRITNFAPFAPTSAYTAAQGASGYFDGTGDYLTAPDNAAFQFGTGDFTVEAWINLTTTVGQAYGACLIVGNNAHGVTTNWLLQIAAATRIIQFYAENPGTVQLLSTKAVNFNEWSHVAVSRTGGTLRLFLNGVQEASTADASSYKDISYPLSIGADGNGNARFGGYISDVRIVKGTAVYTGNFTPPTSPLTAITNTSLLCNFKNAAIFDSAAKNNLETVGNAQIDTTTKKFGSGSIKFDGAGDYLILQPTPTLEPSAGNLTWEMWVNTSSSTQYATLYSRVPSSFGAGMWSLMINLASSTSGDVGLYLGDYSISVPLLQTSVVNVRDANWHHVAVVRSGSSWVLYVDGTSRATNTWTGTITALASAQTRIGTDQFVGGRDYLGYIDDLRITNGVARYTANFTPPTQAFSDT